MRKIKEVLRLRFELGLGQREIARACAISQGAVHNYLKKAATVPQIHIWLGLANETTSVRSKSRDLRS
jgi:DNA-binding transcriptional regulator LsrR (DeoR family)